MALVVDTLLHRWRDPEIKDYFFMSSPTWPTVIMVTYLATIFKIGPKFMENRKPFNLKTIMTIYNIAQVYLNWKLTVLSYNHMKNFCLFCTPNDLPKEAVESHLKIFHFYILLKFFDLLDTIFIVLRKRYNQVTPLHLHHHISMSAVGWIIFSMFPRSCCNYLTFINSFVHVVMYFYYLMTMWIPQLKSVIWIKRSITQIQILQHVSVFALHVSLMLTQNCAVPWHLHCLFLANLLVMIRFFVNYYVGAYIKTKKAQ